MVYLIIGISIVALYFLTGLWFHLLKKSQIAGLRAVYIGTYLRLLVRYSFPGAYEKPGFLAAGVTNDLFCCTPESPEGKEYLRDNSELIKKEAEYVYYLDKEICKAASQGIYYKSLLEIMRPNNEDMMVNLFMAHKKYEDLGYKVNYKPAILGSIIRPFFFYLYAKHFLWRSRTRVNYPPSP